MEEAVFFFENTSPKETNKNIYLVMFKQFEKYQVIISKEKDIDLAKEMYKTVNIEVEYTCLHHIKRDEYICEYLFKKIFDRELSKAQYEKRNIENDVHTFLRMSEMISSYRAEMPSDYVKQPIPCLYNVSSKEEIVKNPISGEPIEENTSLTNFYNIPGLDTKSYHLYYTDLYNTCIVASEYVDIVLKNLHYLGDISIYDEKYNDMILLFHEQPFQNKEEAFEYFKAFRLIYNIDYDKDRDELFKYILLNYEVNEEFSIEMSVLLEELKKGYSDIVTTKMIESYLRKLKVYKKDNVYKGIRRKEREISDKNILDLYEDMRNSRQI